VSVLTDKLNEKDEETGEHLGGSFVIDGIWQFQGHVSMDFFRLTISFMLIDLGKHW
jgi:hypothetical protein